MALKTEQVLSLLKFGNGKNQIFLANHRTPSMNMIKELLSDLEDQKLIEALDYQLEGCQFPLIFHLQLEKELRSSKFHQDKKQKILSWIDDKVGIPRRLKAQVDELYRPLNRNKTIVPTDWEKRTTYISERLPAKESENFHLYINELLQQGYDFHLLVCTAGSLCTININFEKIIQSNEYLLRKVKVVLSENEELIPLNKINWLGTQKQLAELFVELQKKGWIEKPDYTTIKNAFTKSNSIQQVLKPTQDKKSKEKEYEGIYTPQYRPSFFGIKDNPKKHK